jgi:multidrug transporter EmrE-like cation transporter
MMQYILYLKSYLNEPSVTLIATTLGLVWVCIRAAVKKREVSIHDLWMFAVLLVTAITGVFIFFAAFPVIQTSPQNGLWGGVTGVCMAIYSWIQFRKELKRFFSSNGMNEQRATQDSTTQIPHK